MREYGIFTWFEHPVPVKNRMKLIRDAGFQAVMISFDERHLADGEKKESQVDYAHDAGLAVENVHLPFGEYSNDIWRDTLDGEELFLSIAQSLESCQSLGIRTAVMHLTATFDPPPVSDIGLERVGALAERAEDCGVRLALENLMRPEYVADVLPRFPSPYLGFCYDAGHDRLYCSPPYQLPDRYLDRMFALHLHDNDGLKDRHAIPGDGVVDWKAVAGKIEGYPGRRTLECRWKQEDDTEQKAAAFLGRAYAAAVRFFGEPDSFRLDSPAASPRI